MIHSNHISRRNYHADQFKSYERNQPRRIQQSLKSDQLKEKILMITNSNELLNNTLRELREEAQYYLRQNEYLKQEIKIKSLIQLKQKQQYQNAFLQLKEQNDKLIRVVEQKILENIQLNQKIKEYYQDELKYKTKNEEIQSLKQEIQLINQNFHKIKTISQFNIQNEEIMYYHTIIKQLQTKNQQLQNDIIQIKNNFKSLFDKQFQQITKNLKNKIYQQEKIIFANQILIQQLKLVNYHLQNQLNQYQRIQSNQKQQIKMKYSNSQLQQYEKSNQSSIKSTTNKVNKQKQVIIQQLKKQKEILGSKVMEKFDQKIQKFHSYQQEFKNYKIKGLLQKQQILNIIANFFEMYQNQKNIYQQKINQLINQLVIEKNKVKDLYQQSNLLKNQQLKLLNQIEIWSKNV